MANLKGTSNRDVVTVKTGNTYEGGEGDDEITLESGSTGRTIASWTKVFL